jgi:thiol-disulfide isomerase/thioredoxin
MQEILPLLVAAVLAGSWAAPAVAQEAGQDGSEIRPIAGAELDRLLAESRGSVVLVNLWATWCAPCLKEIPELVKLEHELAGRGFKLIGISLDDIDAREAVASFRDEYFPDFNTYHASEADWFALVERIEPNWASVLPTSFVLDKNGEHVATLMGGKDYATFLAAIEPLL